MAARRRRGPTAERVTLFAAALAAAAAVLAPIAAELVKGAGPPPLAGSCLQIQKDYAAAIEAGAAERERILPGVDGRSTLAADPQAQYCGLVPADFEVVDGIAGSPP